MMNSTNLIVRAVVLAAVSLALAACGGDDPGDGDRSADGVAVEEKTNAKSSDPEPSAPIDACALITRDEATAVLGAATREPIRGDTPPVSSCAYRTEKFNVVSVSVITYADHAQAQTAHQFAIKTNNYPEIAGLGDRAYNAQPIGDVTVLVGRYELGVDVSGPENDLEIARDLAETALGRMP